MILKKEKIYNSLLIIISLLILIGCQPKKYEKNITNKEINTMEITINEKDYIIQLENNKTVESLINLLPLDLDMNELNGNEKYIYLDSTLPTNPINPNHINSGDVMLYGNNCLVIFYKSFDTTYSYTKIGHIDNLPTLDNKNIQVKLKTISK